MQGLSPMEIALRHRLGLLQSMYPQGGSAVAAFPQAMRVPPMPPVGGVQSMRHLPQQLGAPRRYRPLGRYV